MSGHSKIKQIKKILLQIVLSVPQWMYPRLLQLLCCSQDLMILPFIYLGAIYTWEEWHRIVNSITVREDVSAQGAPRESHTERLSPKPPRSTANSSVIADQTRPQTDQPCTRSGHWGHSQTQPLLHSPLYPYQYPYSLLKPQHNIFQGLSVTLPLKILSLCLDCV